MIEWGLQILMLGFGVWVVWSLLKPRYVFEIQVKEGRAAVRRGKVTSVFLEHVALACRESGIVRGWIGGVWHKRRVALRFSRHFPPGLQQRLRNVWEFAR
jgi:hypothetical protein